MRPPCTVWSSKANEGTYIPARVMSERARTAGSDGPCGLWCCVLAHAASVQCCSACHRALCPPPAWHSPSAPLACPSRTRGWSPLARGQARVSSPVWMLRRRRAQPAAPPWRQARPGRAGGGAARARPGCARPRPALRAAAPAHRAARRAAASAARPRDAQRAGDDLRCRPAGLRPPRPCSWDRPYCARRASGAGRPWEAGRPLLPV